MIELNILEKMSESSVNETASGDLKDIMQIEIKGTTIGQKLENYLSQVENPYYFRVGKTPVRISFNNTEKPLEEKLKAYFLGLKS